jgi:hypothetical protein
MQYDFFRHKDIKAKAVIGINRSKLALKGTHPYVNIVKMVSQERYQSFNMRNHALTLVYPYLTGTLVVCYRSMHKPGG